MPLDREVERVTGLRIRHARETLAALDRLARERSAENVVALHELHAQHLRDRGDEDGAARADERAERVRQLSHSGRLRLPPPSTA
jgi:hypothetical protein